MAGIVYFMVIVIASTVGAISGMGGGVIIKPLMDSLGFHTVSEISFYSSLSVFTMALISVVKRVRSKEQFHWNLVLMIGVSSIVGGFLGHLIFSNLLQMFYSQLVLMIQTVLILLMLLFSYFSIGWKLRFQCRRSLIYILCGLFLGTLSSFLGIGGGPINVSLLILLFSIPIKEATVYSIAIIFLSQLSHLVSLLFDNHFYQYKLDIVPVILLASIVGGLTGSKVSHILSEKGVTYVYKSIVLLVVGISIFNLLKVLH